MTKETKKTNEGLEIECGDANPKGNVHLTYKGGCRGKLDIREAYRCVGCKGWFHKDCIVKHFELEETHDFGKAELRKDLVEKVRGLRLGKGEDYAGDKNLTNVFNIALDKVLQLIGGKDD